MFDLEIVKVYYFCTIFFFYSGNAGAKEKEIVRYAQETLLIGLADSDPAIR